MELADHVADRSRGLLVPGRRRQAQLAHRVDDAPLHRFQPVTHVRQRAVQDDVHRIVQISALGVFLERHLFEWEVGGYIAHGVILSRNRHAAGRVNVSGAASADRVSCFYSVVRPNAKKEIKMHQPQLYFRHGAVALLVTSLLALPLSGLGQDRRTAVEARDIAAFEISGLRQDPAGNRLYLRTAVIDPVLERLTVSGFRLRQPATRYGLVQFEADRGDAAERLRKAGMEVIAYQPDNAWLVRWNTQQKALAAGISGVRFAGDYTAEMKLAPALLRPGTMSVDVFRLADGALSSPGIGLEVIGFPQTSPRALAAAVAKFVPEARRVESRDGAGWSSLTIWLPESRLQTAIERLAGVRDVYLIDVGRRLEWHNIDSVEPIQANTETGDTTPSATPIWNQGLIGAGQVVAVMDSGLDNNEAWFVTQDNGAGPNTALTDGVSPVPPAIGVSHPDRKVFAYWVQPGATAFDNNEACTPTSPRTGFHGTHVAGTVAADRLATATPTHPAYDDGDGMAPNAQ